MKLSKYFTFKFVTAVIVLLSTTQQFYAQTITKSKQLTFNVKNNATIELNSKYTNVEFELTDENKVTIDAFLEIEGLPEKEVNSYFNKWKIAVNNQENKFFIHTSLKYGSQKKAQQKGFYQGYFIEKNQLNLIEEKTHKSYNTNNKKSVFDFNAYVKDGDVYLKRWEKINNEPIGKRWYNKSKKERIQLQKSRKEKLPKKSNLTVVKNKKNATPKQKLVAKQKRTTKPKANIRALSNRASINKTLKIKIPRSALLHIKIRHGKVIFSHEISNLKADLSYVLLRAN